VVDRLGGLTALPALRPPDHRRRRHRGGGRRPARRLPDHRPEVAAFEAAFAERWARGTPWPANGTAALHLALLALGRRRGDVCIVPSTTFLATANAARYVGAEVVFADVDPDSGLMTPAPCPKPSVAGRANAGEGRAAGAPARRGLRPAGPGATWPAGRRRAGRGRAHALGSTMTFDGVPPERVGDNAPRPMATFSFHPVKTITTGEGGMITTGDAALPRACAVLAQPRHDRPAGAEPWVYEMPEPGFNYRLPDILCALGRSQLSKLPAFAARRRALAAPTPSAGALAPIVRRRPARLVRSGAAPDDRADRLRSRRDDARGGGRGPGRQGIGTQVHYIPVHTQPYYRERYGALDLPGAEAWYDRCLSLPLYPAMEDGDVDRVVAALASALDRP
jgi:dTDP-4-amino-4,6-dideoxygalactose transaminase